MSGLAALPAFAVDAGVRRACTGDYLSYCSQHPVGTLAVRQCMRENGRNLSSPCIDALANAGEISRDDQARHHRRQRSAQR